MSLLYASGPLQFNSAAPSCDCLAHVYGNAADRPDREPVSLRHDGRGMGGRPAFAAGAGLAAVESATSGLTTGAQLVFRLRLRIPGTGPTRAAGAPAVARPRQVSRPVRGSRRSWAAGPGFIGQCAGLRDSGRGSGRSFGRGWWRAGWRRSMAVAGPWPLGEWYGE